MKKVFSVYDKKSEIYGAPFVDVAIGTAERSMRVLANDPKSLVCQFPDDYELYLIGEFDEFEGQFTDYAEKVRVCGASDVKEKKQDEVRDTVHTA